MQTAAACKATERLSKQEFQGPASAKKWPNTTSPNCPTADIPAVELGPVDVLHVDLMADDHGIGEEVVREQHRPEGKHQRSHGTISCHFFFSSSNCFASKRHSEDDTAPRPFLCCQIVNLGISHDQGPVDDDA